MFGSEEVKKRGWKKKSKRLVTGLNDTITDVAGAGSFDCVRLSITLSLKSVLFRYGAGPYSVVEATQQVVPKNISGANRTSDGRASAARIQVSGVVCIAARIWKSAHLYVLPVFHSSVQVQVNVQVVGSRQVIRVLFVLVILSTEWR